MSDEVYARNRAHLERLRYQRLEDTRFTDPDRQARWVHPSEDGFSVADTLLADARLFDFLFRIPER